MKVNNSDLVSLMKMQIKYKSLSRTCFISYHSSNYKKDQGKSSDRNLDQPNEYSWASRSEKTIKIMIPSPFPAILWIVSVCQGKYRKKKKKKKERKKERRKRKKERSYFTF